MNPGNTLYVTGLSGRVTERDLEEHFSKEGKVVIVLYILSFLTLLLQFMPVVSLQSFIHN